MLSKKLVVASIAIIAITVIFSAIISTELQSNNKGPTYSTIAEKSSLLNKSSTTVTIFNTPYIKEYPLAYNTWPNAILTDKNGIVWIIGSKSHTLIKLDPKQEITLSYLITEDSAEDKLSKSYLMAWTMVQDNYGKIWFSRLGEDKIWSFNPSTTKFTSLQSSSSAWQMKIDQESGDIWFTTLTGNTIGLIQKVENGTEPLYNITEFPLGNDTVPSGLFLKDGSVWVTELSKGRIAKFDVVRNNDGLIVNIKKTLEMPQSNQTQFYSPTDVLVSGNRAVWVTEHGPSTMTRYDAIPGKLTRFPTSQRPDDITTLPFWMRESTDRKGIWFNEHQGGRVAFFNPYNMALTEYELQNSTTNPVVYTLNLAIDPSDSSKLWFSQWNLDRVGVVDHTIPLPFDIKSNLTKVVLSDKNTTATINVEISGNNSSAQNHNMVFLKASSSMMPDGGFANMTDNFTVSSVDLSKVNQAVPVQLILQNDGAKAGNYTLGISATDGIVTKTIFLDLIVT